MKCKICKGKTKLLYTNLFDDRHGYPGYFSVRRCLNCGFAQTDPQIPQNKISLLYKNYYPRQNLDLSKIKKSDFKAPGRVSLWKKGLLADTHWWVKPGSTVLDVGSGVGYSLLSLLEMGCSAYGIDPDENAKAFAKKFKLNFHHGFIEDQPFAGKSFDYVIVSQVLEHTNDPSDFLKECKKRLNINGKLILSFPNINSLTRKILGKKWLHWHIPYHLNHFSKASIKLLAERTNLQIESIRTITPNLWTNIQIRNLLEKPKMGVRDPFWDGGKQKEASRVLASPFFGSAARFLENYNFANRILDLLGLGESFVVILSAV